MTNLTDTITQDPKFTQAVDALGATSGAKNAAIQAVRDLYNAYKKQEGFNVLVFTGSKSPIRLGFEVAYGKTSKASAASIQKIVREVVDCAINSKGFVLAKDLTRNAAGEKAKELQKAGVDAVKAAKASGTQSAAPSSGGLVKAEPAATDRVHTVGSLQLLRNVASHCQVLATWCTTDKRPTPNQVWQELVAIGAALELLAGQAID